MNRIGIAPSPFLQHHTVPISNSAQVTAVRFGSELGYKCLQLHEMFRLTLQSGIHLHGLTAQAFAFLFQ